MLDTLPKLGTEVMDWGWEKFRPYYDELISHNPDATNVDDWLKDWSHLNDLVSEVYTRLSIATTLNTADEDARNKLTHFLDHVQQPAQQASQKLKEKLLASGLEPDGFHIPLRNMRSEAALFRPENLPLLVEDEKLGLVYDEIIGGMTVRWNGDEITLTQLAVTTENADRAAREKAWRLGLERVLSERQKINENWGKLVEIRRKIAANAGKKDFRDYMWQARLRFDYTPDDAQTFHRAIEEVVVPAAERAYMRRRQALGVDALRPWDVGTDVMRSTDFTGDPLGREALHPFTETQELEEKGELIFSKVHPELGEQFRVMRREDLLNLSNYKGKAPGAYCSDLATLRKPFIFMNAVGSSADVFVLLHETGHAFHQFAIAHLPYHQLRDYPIEFAEVASMGMELLGSPYLKGKDGGFYTPQEHARALIEHLEKILLFWPYMAVVDSFQHWVYTHQEGDDPLRCDAIWGELWDRFIQGVDWNGLHDQKVTGWHRKLHIHRLPFYYVEYGLAQLGAVQVWANALKGQSAAVSAYRQALSLGGTVTLPELYHAAGAKFAFDAGTLRKAVELVEARIEQLQQV